jgi:hypothetical protein
MRVLHVLRKPLSEGTVARNVVKHCAGGINIDASRVGTHGEVLSCSIADPYHAKDGSQRTWNPTSTRGVDRKQHVDGRWPANVILTHLAGCHCEGIKRVKGSNPCTSGGGVAHKVYGVANVVYGPYQNKPVNDFTDPDGNETVANWVCEPGCPVAVLDARGGSTTSKRSMRGVGWSDSEVFGVGDPGFDTKRGYDDEGGVSRFYKQIGGKHEGTP